MHRLLKNVECYGRDFAGEMEAIVQNKLRGAKRVTLEEVDSRPLPLPLRELIQCSSQLFSLLLLVRWPREPRVAETSPCKLTDKRTIGVFGRATPVASENLRPI